MKELIKQILREERNIILEKFKVSDDEYLKLFKNNNFELVVPLTFNASKKYGANTKWCTTSECDDTMFNKHLKMGSLSYIIVKDKDIADRIGFSKIGLYINKPDANFLGGKFPAPEGIMFYDDKNTILSQSQIENNFDKVDALTDYYQMIRKFVDYSGDKFKNITESEDEITIKPSELAQKNICDSEKFCSAQGKITFGQLKAIVESATQTRLLKHIGEGGYKATLRLLPWFLPQLALAGFITASIRAMNKIFRPTLNETTSYKTWWGKTIMRLFDVVEGELNTEDPLSRIFFISDGLMTMMNDKYKIKFAHYISNLAESKLDNEEVPEYFVENELRNWLNQKFLLNPPLPIKIVK